MARMHGTPIIRTLPKPKPVLSRREREVLGWIAQGKTARETSEVLSIAERTVEAHVNSAMRKLKAKTRTHAVAIALRDRVIEF